MGPGPNEILDHFGPSGFCGAQQIRECEYPGYRRNFWIVNGKYLGPNFEVTCTNRKNGRNERIFARCVTVAVLRHF